MSEELPRPRTGKIRAAVQYSGIGRSSLYELAPQYEGLFLKFKKSTLVNFEVLDRIINALPPAKIKAPPAKKKSSSNAATTTTLSSKPSPASACESQSNQPSVLLHPRKHSTVPRSDQTVVAAARAAAVHQHLRDQS